MAPRANTPEDIWNRIDRSGGPLACWPYTGTRQNGYGVFKIRGKQHKAHRVVFELENGKLPEFVPDETGIVVRHLCNNPPCCNPKHLASGLHQDNADDRERSGNTARGENSGAKRHPDRIATGSRNGSTKYPEIRQGVRNGRAKMDDDKVREMRKLSDTGVHVEQLMKMFELGETSTRAIVNRTGWKHVV